MNHEALRDAEGREGPRARLGEGEGLPRAEEKRRPP